MQSKTTEAEPVEALVPEIERYLSIVEYFRGEGCEPHWSSEAWADVRAVPAASAADDTGV